MDSIICQVNIKIWSFCCEGHGTWYYEIIYPYIDSNQYYPITRITIVGNLAILLMFIRTSAIIINRELAKSGIYWKWILSCTKL